MSFAHDLEISQDVLEDVIFPPGDLDSDEPPLESELHLRQMVLLIQCLEWWWRDRMDFYACGNLTIYYSPRQRKSEQFRGPDFFVVLGTQRKPRKSWVVWEEDGKYPNVIVEILSSKTAATDRGLKKQIYQDIFRTPDYFGFSPDSLEFKGFHLLDGRYQELEPKANGWLWSQQLELYLGIHESRLRFFTAEGQLIPTPEEMAQQERQQKEQAEQQVAEMEALLVRYRERFGELPA
ncbi:MULTISPECIES: Uma2 family endonuclease [Cyanophyceae]|uniref:Uma2 family endonuclease n=1 Tax=Cyanophyceae TaxID=3028117 RepID=UPI0016831C66|nr:Uma2 family endonuclease [Trichocoleus sp. FACHB-69]MBD1933422.1 Uma2 family endonuclease [Trichocoleus sp. FACHB-69]